MSRLIDNAWLRLSNNPLNPPCNLICFPFAGGFAEYYLPWAQLLPDIGLYPVQLPGRSSRWQESPIVDIQELLNAMLPSLLSVIQQKPYVLFGHSMGGYISYMMARKIKALGLREPLFLVISAAPAPQTWGTRSKLSALSQKEFADFFMQLGGFHPEILKHQSFVEMQLNLLRKDVQLCESCQVEDAAGFSFPIWAISGEDDPVVTSVNMNHWQRETNAQFVHKNIPGDHFYITKKKDRLVSLIAQEIDRQLLPELVALKEK